MKNILIATVLFVGFNCFSADQKDAPIKVEIVETFGTETICISLTVYPNGRKSYLGCKWYYSDMSVLDHFHPSDAQRDALRRKMAEVEKS